jgi:biopolymer transport protein ExbB
MEFNVEVLWNTMSLPVKLNTIFMLILSIYMVFVIVERFAVYNAATKHSLMVVQALHGHLSKQDVAAALKSTEGHQPSPVARVVGAGLRALVNGREALGKQGPADVGHFDIVDSVNRAMDRVKERETARMRGRLGGLASVATATPFIGLFGTVLGIIKAFGLLKDGGSIDKIGPAIAEALYSTAFGLLVAIPAAMFFNYFTTRVETLVVDMNDISSELIDFVLREGRA